MNKHATILATFFERVHELGTSRVALAAKRSGRWREWSWAEYGEMVSRTACGLRALGFAAGDRVTILAANTPEWLWADLAAMSCGGAAAGIYLNDLPDQVRYVNEHSDAKIAFVDTLENLAKTDSFRGGLESLDKVVVFAADEAELPDDPEVISFAQLLELGRAEYEADPGRVERDAREIDSEAIGMVVYTSGTTGRPKGALYSHANIVFEAEVLAAELGGDHAISISFLPLCHIAERLQGELVAIACGNSVYFAESLETVKEDLLEVRPTLLLCVPRLWEKFHAGISAKFAAETGLKARLIAATQKLGAEVYLLRNSGRAPAGMLALKWRLVERLVVNKLRIALGLDRCQNFISGAAPLAAEIADFFGALGMDIREVYGQTESIGVISVNPRGGIRSGTVGVALAGTEVRIAEEGEIQARGPHVFAGYLKDEDATRETVDEQGWLHTGDVGEIDAKGYIRVTDRLKDIIVTAGGKNVAPQNIENRLKLVPAISQVVVIGDRRPYLVALVTLDEGALGPLCDNLDVAIASAAELAGNEKINRAIQASIKDVNQDLARHETIKKFVVLPRELSVDAGEITPTLKLKRRVIQRKWAEEIEALYAE